ncbi:lysoplasmalogenase [Roseivirga sp.]|uniref:lysoplasmalogenase n=1 Tax=Roseivirga sp. TaxID=1964215 RepID=UPI003B8CB057
MKINKSLYPFLVVAILDLACRLLQVDELLGITKSLLMPSLFFFVYKTCPSSLLKQFLLMAIGLSFLGDVLLLFMDNEKFFLLGLGCFLVVHLLYAFIFFNANEEAERKMKLQWQDSLFIIYGLIIFSILKGNLGTMYVPALLYTVVICLMGLTARKRWKKTSYDSFWLVMIGATLFIISDTILALDKFYVSFAVADFLIMFTYILAQGLIALGLISFIQKIRPEAGS